MTKAELANQIADSTGIEKTLITEVVEALMVSISQSLIANENVYLRGFGTFATTYRKAKIGRNITQKTSIAIPAHNVPTFKACSEFVEKVKRGNWVNLLKFNFTYF